METTGDQWKKGYHMIDDQWWLATYAVTRDFGLDKQQINELLQSGKLEVRALQSEWGSYNVYRLADLERL